MTDQRRFETCCVDHVSFAGMAIEGTMPMGIAFSRKGLDVDYELNLPFTNSMAVRFQIANPVTVTPPNPALAFDATQNTHLWLLFSATTLVESRGAAGRKLHQLVKPWHGKINDAFHDGLCRGLWDADKNTRYNDPLLDMLPTWRSHFYDPDTCTNWMGQTTPTAVTQGSAFYQQAQSAYQHGKLAEAGHHLGLALHYLTDLTQPMHAANFTWLHSQSFGYHTHFERYVRANLHLMTAPSRYTPRIKAAQLEAYFKAVARHAKDAYIERLCKPAWTQHFSEADRSFAVWENRVGAVVPHILRDAVQMTAEFLLMWMEETQAQRPKWLQWGW
jgi:phospholipase C